MTRDVVVGVQDAEERVLERAISEATTTHRPLRVLTAWSGPVWTGDLAGLGYSGAYVAPEECQRSAQQLVDGLLDKALSHRPDDDALTVTAEAHPGHAGRLLLDTCPDAGLVVVGGRSHGPLASTLLGSTTGYVLHHARGPVMVVPTSAAPGPFARVVVGMDDAPCSRSALRWALDAALRHSCPLHVVFAQEVVLVPGPSTYAPDVAATERWLNGRIEQTLPLRRGVTVTSEVIDGTASSVLLTQAESQDLLVLGSRGRGGFLGLLLGSVASQCTAHARGPVVVVRAEQERLDEV